MRLLRGSLRARWWTWITLWAMVAACGKFGVGWLVNEVRYDWNPTGYEEAEWLPGLGGLYWWMNLVLPGHVGFRYPAKLWTLASLGIAVLAGLGCSQLRLGAPTQARRLVGWAGSRIPHNFPIDLNGALKNVFPG